jgi:hypothetical protein
VTTRHAPINRTGYPPARRASGWEGIHTDTVPSDPSAARNAEGARLPTGPRSCLVGSSPIRGSYADRKGETAMPEVTASAPGRTTTTHRVMAAA